MRYLLIEDAKRFSPTPTDALIIVDVQKDFLPGGALGVPGGNEIITPINQLINLFIKAGGMVVATRDWHPKNHSSFKENGGIWPAHCVQGTPGAEFADGLNLPPTAVIISKATNPEVDAYSGFVGTNLETQLKKRGIKRTIVCGLATDYCVLNTALDASKAGFQVIVPKSCIRAVNINPADGDTAIGKMQGAGAEIGETTMNEGYWLAPGSDDDVKDEDDTIYLIKSSKGTTSHSAEDAKNMIRWLKKQGIENKKRIRISSGKK